ncbi:LOW QUALITY PROTEIN: hypothetical protein CH63R_06435 [Colletotrichum higginsianum IMI 349063]|uniref:Uncharacterized protein n=1 Tax=Colletotrichum higginsianum (strain IMI 349063) TaxID=759273 RepID=A0A1B7YF71_COLHI|nr:LOW QUALITY PROTEIN: hypothetical protein CH63R_06435 [Colletotrichum higginsianum IMI 349063]OBR10743.1 LOW QUALITY PROTEIN: hypothetical protein CH63R_06435 [Colletotrichum higginsianum IMI 349063]
MGIRHLPSHVLSVYFLAVHNTAESQACFLPQLQRETFLGTQCIRFGLDQAEKVRVDGRAGTHRRGISVKSNFSSVAQHTNSSKSSSDKAKQATTQQGNIINTSTVTNNIVSIINININSIINITDIITITTIILSIFITPIATAALLAVIHLLPTISKQRRSIR